MAVKKKTNLKLKLDRIFSEFIRKRDSKNGYFKCISCGQIKPYAQADCGHYFSRSKLNTRFDENNCHAECSHCNRFLSDHLEGYRINLIKKIGKSRFDTLKIRSQQFKQITDFEYTVLIKHYKSKLKELER